MFVSLDPSFWNLLSGWLGFFLVITFFTESCLCWVFGFFLPYIVMNVDILLIVSQYYSEERILVSFLNIETCLVLHLLDTALDVEQCQLN